MIRRHLMVLRLALMVVDALSAALVFALVSLVRFGDGDAAELWRQIGIDIRVGAAVSGSGLGRGAVVPRPLPAARPLATADRGQGHRPGDVPGAGGHAVDAVPLPPGQRQPAVPRPAVRHPAAGHAGRAHRPSLRRSAPFGDGASTRGSCSSPGPGALPRASPTGSRPAGARDPGGRPSVDPRRVGTAGLAADPRQPRTTRGDLPLAGHRRGRDLSPAERRRAPRAAQPARGRRGQDRPDPARPDRRAAAERRTRRSSRASSCGPGPRRPARARVSWSSG